MSSFPWLTLLGVVPLVGSIVVVLLPKAWDVVLNPLVGNWSDHTESRWGSRIPWMVRGASGAPSCGGACAATPP